MNKKILTGIVTLGIITAGAANAAITKEQCNRSDKTVWVANVANADGTKGACVPKNTCKSANFKKNFCVTTFKDTQVGFVSDAHDAINTYVKTQLKWTEGCTQFLDFDVDNMTGQDYIGCLSNGRYRTFEFDDTSHTPAKGAVNLRASFRLDALCIAVGGKPNLGARTCDNVNQTSCSTIEGNYDSSTSTCRLYKTDAGQSSTDTFGFGSSYENYITR